VLLEVFDEIFNERFYIKNVEKIKQNANT